LSALFGQTVALIAPRFVGNDCFAESHKYYCLGKWFWVRMCRAQRGTSSLL
jgi:hypothetical protein